MKKILIVLMLSLVFVGCGEPEEPNISKTADKRLVTVETTSEYAIEVDKETKVMYVYHYRGGGMTYMVDENGRPLLWKGELE